MALALNPSIFPQSVVYSAMVMSLVQHNAVAGDVPLAGLNGVVHFFASSGLVRMLVVVCKSVHT